MWRAKSKVVLEEENIKQSYTDGCTREHAFGYQLFVLQFFSLCRVIGDRIQDSFSDEFLARLLLSTDFGIMSIIDAGPCTKLGWISNAYHAKQNSKCIVISSVAEANYQIRTVIQVAN